MSPEFLYIRDVQLCRYKRVFHQVHNIVCVVLFFFIFWFARFLRIRMYMITTEVTSIVNSIISGMNVDYVRLNERS